MTNLPYQTDDVKLREHLEALLREQRQYFEMKLKAIEDATNLARQTMNERLDGMNEFRGTLKDRQATMITRVNFESAMERVRVQLDELEKFKNIAEGKASQSSVIFFGFLSVASLLISIIKLIMG